VQAGHAVLRIRQAKGVLLAHGQKTQQNQAAAEKPQQKERKKEVGERGGGREKRSTKTRGEERTKGGGRVPAKQRRPLLSLPLTVLLVGMLAAGRRG
jgi:hypothetical protein